MATEAVEVRRFYSCTFPGCPCPVNIAFDVVKALEEAAQTSTGSSQGLLYGGVSPLATEVRGAQPVNEFTAEVLGAAMPADGSAVGYYRIRDTDTLSLTDEELAIAEAHFARPGCVVLLIQRSLGAHEANFFFREGGSFLNLALLSFPLNATTLSRRMAERARVEDERAGERRAALVEVAKPPDVTPVVAEQPNAPIRGRRRIGLLGFSVLLVAAAGLGVAIGYWRHDQIRVVEPRAAAASVTPDGALPLRAERQGTDLKISWDLNAPALTTAAAGSLEIEDGAAKRTLPLDTRQIRFGSLLYAPASDQISIGLTVTSTDGKRTQGSLIAILSKADGGGSIVTMRKPAAPAGEQAGVRTQATREFVPPAAAAPSTPSTPVDQMPQAQVRLQTPAITLPGTVAPPPPRAAESSAAGPPFSPPVLTYQAGVQVPTELRRFQTKMVVVTIRAVVDEAGRVVSVDRSPQAKVHAAFVNAAADAALRCRFRPARLGDTPVRSDVVIGFRFNPE